jgi:hypothetical protein
MPRETFHMETHGRQQMQCMCSGVLEDYQHFFIEFEMIQPFLQEIDCLLENLGLQNIIKLKHILIGQLSSPYTNYII